MASLIKNSKATKTYSDKPEDMLVLAKQYARKDFTQSIELVKSLGIDICDSVVAKALIDLKYTRIENVRNSRVTYFD